MIDHLLIEVFLLAFIIFSEIHGRLERKNLLDRIMSRNYSEYNLGELQKEQVKVQSEILDDRGGGIPL